MMMFWTFRRFIMLEEAAGMNKQRPHLRVLAGACMRGCRRPLKLDFPSWRTSRTTPKTYLSAASRSTPRLLTGGVRSWASAVLPLCIATAVRCSSYGTDRAGRDVGIVHADMPMPGEGKKTSRARWGDASKWLKFADKYNELKVCFCSSALAFWALFVWCNRYIMWNASLSTSTWIPREPRKKVVVNRFLWDPYMCP